MRLIDADALKTRKSINSANYNSIETIQEWIDNAPTIDAVPVVRCKDCEHSKEWYRDRLMCHVWAEFGVSVFEDGFCNYGERRK